MARHLCHTRARSRGRHIFGLPTSRITIHVRNRCSTLLAAMACVNRTARDLAGLWNVVPHVRAQIPFRQLRGAFSRENRGRLSPGRSIYTIDAAVAEKFWLPGTEYCLTKTKAMGCSAHGL